MIRYSAATRKPLSGVRVLVTRPQHQAEHFCRLVEAAGGQVIRFPVLEIRDADDMSKVVEVSQRLAHYDIAIFVSPNAVNKSIPLLTRAQPLPARLQLAAIGRFTAAAMAEFGYPAHIFPEHKFNSEGLLELPEMQAVEGKRIVILRGNDGRELLADALRERGANVEYVAVYQRLKPKADAARLTRLMSHGEINLIAITSSQSVRNLFDMAGERERRLLSRAMFLLGSRRIEDTAKAFDDSLQTIVANDPGDEAMLAAALDWSQRSPHSR